MYLSFLEAATVVLVDDHVILKRLANRWRLPPSSTVSIIRSDNMAPLSAAVDCHVMVGLGGCPTAKVHMPACLSAAVNAMSFSVARYGRWPAPTRGITAAMIMLMVAKMLSAPTLVLE